MTDVAVFEAMFVVALVAESMTAALAAGRRRMDWFGVGLLGWVTALGGGSLRDIVLGHYPLVWVEQPLYILLTAGAALATIPLASFMHQLRMVFLSLDAIGLVLFSVIGCNVAITLGQPVIVVIVAGMITGCFGGVLRDVLCNEVPLLFRSELYASVSIVTSAVYVGGLSLGLPHDPVMVAAMAIGLALRLLAIRFNWHMPQFVYTQDLHGPAE